VTDTQTPEVENADPEDANADPEEANSGTEAETADTEAETADPGEVNAASEEAPTGARGRWPWRRGRESGRRRPGAWTWLVLLAGVVAVVVAFLSYRDADHDPDRARAALRDRAVIEGTAAVETMNSMDYRDVAGGLKAWESVTTGVLHDQLLSIGDDERKLLAENGKIATGHVVQAALTDLTDHTATMIAAVETTVVDDGSGEEPTVKRNRYTADLVLVDGHWKLENLEQVAVNLS
jgi:Mce-associated membrane protein